MRCQRCGGLMICERFYDGRDHFEGWRCVICGEIVDSVIVENRIRRYNLSDRKRESEGVDVFAEKGGFR